MVKLKLLGNAKKVVGNDILLLDSINIDDILNMLSDKGIDTNELLILINGVEASLTDKNLKDDDIVTIASIVHGG